jgi:hypothetical protein
MIAARFKTWEFWKRLLLEFWIAAVLATIWTCYKFSQSTSFGVGDAITYFGPSFFLAAWFTGQFVRVDRQKSVDENLNIIRTEMAAFVETTKKVAKLQDQLLQRATTDPALAKTLVEISKLTAQANTHLLAANTAATSTLAVVALTAADLTTGPPELGRPHLTAKSN